MKRHNNSMKLGVAALAATIALAPLAHATSVYLNGQPLATSAPPVQRNGRTLVPMRSIFEALGATVNWNPLSQSISANSGARSVYMAIGKRQAMVNGQTVNLDQSPLLFNGSTMVPLRFVSEAMGATVDWNSALQAVSITSSGNNGSGTAVAGVRTISVPAGVVVPVTLDEPLTSATARVGQAFTASVLSQRLGDSEFPAGSKIQGSVIEVRAKEGDNPGVLDLRFDTAILPDGSRVNLNGELASLESDSVTTTNGRIVAKTSSRSSGDRLKVIGIGAGAGFLIGKVLLKKNGVLSAILGAAGGFLYDQSKNKAKTNEAVLPVGAKLGVRLNSAISYADHSGYADSRSSFLRM